MSFVKLIWSKKGKMAYQIGEDNFLDTEGNEIKIPQGEMKLVSANGITPSWGSKDVIYKEVSFIEGSLETYMNLSGNIYDVDGNKLTPDWLRKNGWTENQTVDAYPDRLDWMDALENPPIADTQPEPIPAP